MFLKKSTVLNIIEKDHEEVTNSDEWGMVERILVKKKNNSICLFSERDPFDQKV